MSFRRLIHTQKVHACSSDLHVDLGKRDCRNAQILWFVLLNINSKQWYPRLSLVWAWSQICILLMDSPRVASTPAHSYTQQSSHLGMKKGESWKPWAAWLSICIFLPWITESLHEKQAVHCFSKKESFTAEWALLCIPWDLSCLLQAIFLGKP